MSEAISEGVAICTPQNRVKELCTIIDKCECEEPFEGVHNGSKYTIQQCSSNAYAVMNHHFFLKYGDKTIFIPFNLVLTDECTLSLKQNVFDDKYLKQISPDNSKDTGFGIISACMSEYYNKFRESIIKMHEAQLELYSIQRTEKMIREQHFLIRGKYGQEDRVFVIPEDIGYFMDNNSLYRHMPPDRNGNYVPPAYIGSACIISAIGTDINNGHQYYHLHWRDGRSHFKDRWVSCDFFYSKNGLLAVTTETKSCIFSEAYWKFATKYFQELIATDDARSEDERQIERIDIVEFNGWVDDSFTCLVAGGRTFAKHGAPKYQCINNHFIKEFSEKGFLVEWVKGMGTAGILGERHVRFTMDAALASLLLGITGTKTFLIHLKADTSKGKTTTCLIALTLFGDPDALLQSMNATANGIEAWRRAQNGFAVFLDETTASENKNVQQITYRSTGPSKMRATKTGGLSDSKKAAECIFILTGEASHISSTSFGGQGVRMLEVPFSMKHIGRKEFARIKKAIMSNHGLLLPLIMEELFSMDIAAELVEIDRVFNDDSNINNRITEYALPICLAHIILDRVFARINKMEDVVEEGIQIPMTTYQDVVLPTMEEIKENAEIVETPMYIRVLESLFEVLSLEQKNEGDRFSKTTKDDDGSVQVMESGDNHVPKFKVNPQKRELYINPTAYFQMMTDYTDFDEDAINNALTEWKKKDVGILKTSGKNHRLMRSWGDVDINSYVLDLDVINKLTGLDYRGESPVTINEEVKEPIRRFYFKKDPSASSN